MSLQDILGTIGERLAATANARTVYGDPVTAGGRTVLPVATVRYGFGAGGGKGTGEAATGGGGGGVLARPCGALEITAEGTRFVPFVAPTAVWVALAAGFAIGAVAVAIGGKKRIEIVKERR